MALIIIVTVLVTLVVVGAMNLWVINHYESKLEDMHDSVAYWHNEDVGQRAINAELVRQLEQAKKDILIVGEGYKHKANKYSELYREHQMLRLRMRKYNDIVANLIN